MKKSNQVLRKGLSLVLSFALTMGSMAGTGMTAYAEEAVQNQLAYYSFENAEGQTVIDEWGDRNGILASSASIVEETKSGKALLVTAAGEGMTFADDLTQLDEADWTLCYWVKHTTDLTGEVSVTEDAAKGFSTSLRFSSSSNRNATGFRVGDKDGDVLTFTTEKPAANEWHHLAWVQDKDGVGMMLYVDGIKVGQTATWTKNNAVKAPVDIIGGTGFTGYIDEVKLYHTALSAGEVAEAMRVEGEVLPCGTNIGSLFNSDPDNSWVFTGGRAVEGGFADVRGARNFVGHYEEYIRNTKSAGDDPNRQRHTINTAKAGQTLAQILENWDNRVSQFKPQAVAYMAGSEDYSAGAAGIAAFQENLKSFIDKALAEKDGTGIAVIQTPYAVNDETENTTIEAYIAAIDAVVAGYQEMAEQYANILVVDYYESTRSNSTFRTTMLDEEGNLNALGHTEIGRLLSLATLKTDNNYPASQGIRTNAVSRLLVEAEQPDHYLNVQPTVISKGTVVQVTIPEIEEGIIGWNYQLDMEGTLISGTAESNDFTIEGLVADKAYVLTVRSQDEETQLRTMKGVVGGGAGTPNTQVLDEKQQKLADKMAEKDSMTWLFLGDSITHGLVYTYGYDNVPQTVEKYLKNVLGRENDVVINTAVSSATTQSTLDNIEHRLTKYSPDVVSIMLGTNDAAFESWGGVSREQYEINLRALIAKVKEVNPEAVIILRSPTPMTGNGEDASYRRPRTLENIEVMKAVAEDLDLIYINQYDALEEALTTYSWLGDGGINGRGILGNFLHPGPTGLLLMGKMFIKSCGLWTDDSELSNLFYDLKITETISEFQPEILNTEDQIYISAEKLEADSGLQLGEIALTAVNAAGQSYRISAKDSEAYVVLENLPGNQTYTVTVDAYVKGSAQHVTFAPAAEIWITGKDIPEITEPEPPEEEREEGEVLKPTITTNAKGSKITLQKNQRTADFRITGLAKGDSVVSIASSDSRVVKVSKVDTAKGSCVLKAGKLTGRKGKATLTITLKSGLTKKIKVTVQKAAVKTAAITKTAKRLTLTKGQSVKLKPVLVPFTSQDKVKFTSNKKNVVTVTSKGKIKAKKKGKAVITVKAGKKTAKVKVTVKNK